MLSHNVFHLPHGNSKAAINQRAATIETAILRQLTNGGPSTVALLVTLFSGSGVSHNVVRYHLNSMREGGMVRHFKPAKNNDVAVGGVRWELGEEADKATFDEGSRRLTRAVQLGTFQRDPLVAALFGAAPAHLQSGAS